MPPKGKEKVKLPDYFERREDGDIRCLACESDWIKRSSVSKHQQSAGHVDSLRIYENRRVERAASNLRQSNAVDLSHPPPNQSVFTQQTDTWVSNDLRHLDINGLDTNNWDDVQFSAGVPDSPPLGSQLDSELPAFDIFEPDSDAEDNEFAMPLPQRIIDSLNQSAINLELLQAQFHNLNSTSNWAPYESKIMFLLDLLDNIPRLRLSTEHLKLIMWVMEEAGCHNIPTFNKLRSTQQQLRNICSVQSHQYQSSKGNVFDMLDIPQLIGRDLSNPIVAPHLVFYPEDSGNTLAESWQADKWKDKIPLDQLTPMYADGNKFYYVNELARLHNGSYVIPNRWITRDGVLTADCWPVIWRSVPDDEPNSGFCVQQGLIQVPSTAFASNYYDLIEHMEPQSYRFAGPFTSYQRKMPNSLRQLTNNSEELLSCFIKPWCDDVSGGRTKQYQPHNNIYVAHANLPGNLLNQEYFVRFASTSTHTSSLEQFEAIKQQLDANNKKPIRVYNVVSGRFVRLRIYIINLPADNRAQSEAASHVCGGNCLCRKCNVGGGYQYVETAEGYAELFLPGTPRDPEATVQEIWSQIKTAYHGVEDHVSKMQTKSGIKDQTAQDIIIKLIKRGRELKKQAKQSKEPLDDEALIKKQTDWLESQPTKPFNVLFQIHGLDPHRDTPVEILHTILLGVEKYAWHTLHSSTNSDAHQTFETRLQSSNILSLNIDPIRASYIMKYRNNLIGRQLKMLMQLTAFHIHDLVHSNLFALVKAVGELGAVLWYSEIHNLDLYLSDLRILIDNVLDSFAQFDPRRIIAKMKLHMLTHLIEDIQNHGPAVRFSTEIFECYNGVFRMCSILSNHQAPSRDIARKMIELERFRHIVSGGYWETSSGEVTCASVEVRRYFQTSLKLQTHLGWVKPEVVKPGEIKLRSTKNPHTLSWKDTAGSKANLDGPLSQQKWYEAESVTAASGDVCKPGYWVVATQSTGTIIGRIQQILMDANTQVHGIVIIDQFKVADERHSILGMPVLIQREVNMNHIIAVASYGIEFSLNVQHDCLTLHCPTSGVETIRQERLNTTIERQSIEHHPESIFIVNMHALHNAQRIREVLPRDLTKPIPINAPDTRLAFLGGLAVRMHEQQKERRAELARKRKAARDARDREDQPEEH